MMQSALALAEPVTPARHVSLLDGSVESILLQFRFGERNLVPLTVWGKDVTSIANTEPVRQFDAGTRFIGKTPNVGVRAFVMEVEFGGYLLTHAESKIEPDPRPDKRGKNVYRVSYVFRQQPHAGSPNPAQMALIRQHFAPALKLLSKCNWIARAYRNPHVNKPDVYGISITCENFGAEPTRTPQKFLRILDNTIVLE